MSLWILFQRWAVKHFTQLTGRNLLFALIGYILTSWILLFIANEIALTHSVTDFIYLLPLQPLAMAIYLQQHQLVNGLWRYLLFPED